VIFAIRPADYLIVLAVFADLLETAVQVADMRDAANDRLAIELQYQPQDAVCRRMLRTDVDEHVLTFEIGLDSRRRLEGETPTSIIGEHRNALGSSLRIETGSGELNFDGAFRHLLARPLAFAQSVAHLLRQFGEGISDRQLLHRVACFRILRQRLSQLLRAAEPSAQRKVLPQRIAFAVRLPHQNAAEIRVATKTNA